MTALGAAGVCEILQGWIEDRVGTPVSAEARFAEVAALDSFDVLQLILFAESRFELKFTPADFADPAFASLAGMARLIASRL